MRKVRALIIAPNLQFNFNGEVIPKGSSNRADAATFGKICAILKFILADGENPYIVSGGMCNTENIKNAIKRLVGYVDTNGKQSPSLDEQPVTAQDLSFIFCIGHGQKLLTNHKREIFKVSTPYIMSTYYYSKGFFQYADSLTRAYKVNNGNLELVTENRKATKGLTAILTTDKSFYDKFTTETGSSDDESNEGYWKAEEIQLLTSGQANISDDYLLAPTHSYGVALDTYHLKIGDDEYAYFNKTDDQDAIKTMYNLSADDHTKYYLIWVVQDVYHYLLKQSSSNVETSGLELSDKAPVYFTSEDLRDILRRRTSPVSCVFSMGNSEMFGQGLMNDISFMTGKLTPDDIYYNAASNTRYSYVNATQGSYLIDAMYNYCTTVDRKPNFKVPYASGPGLDDPLRCLPNYYGMAIELHNYLSRASLFNHTLNYQALYGTYFEDPKNSLPRNGYFTDPSIWSGNIN